MDDGRWTMDDGRWTMDDGRWKKIYFQIGCINERYFIFKSIIIVHSL